MFQYEKIKDTAVSNVIKPIIFVLFIDKFEKEEKLKHL